MHVVGHEDVATSGELKLCADLSECLQEEIFAGRGPQVGAAVVTAEGEEMEVFLAIAALESLGHGKKRRVTHPLQTAAQRVGHPGTYTG